MIIAILYPISLLPLSALYLISDICTFLLYNIFKYRRKVVYNNINNSLYYLTDCERNKIERQFYKNFCDNFFETLKLLSISEKELQNRITADYTLLEKIITINKNCHIYLGHQFNWEWANAHIASVLKKENILVVYKQLSNKSANKLMIKIRSRFGSKMIESRNMKRNVKEFADQNHILILVADQNPSNPQKSFWTSFLSQRTAFLGGSELNTANHKTPSFFANIIREKRGQYKFVLTPIFDFTKPYYTGLITTIFTEKLENTIVTNPENYLWSHKRWKHKYKNDYSKRWLKKTEEFSEIN